MTPEQRKMIEDALASDYSNLIGINGFNLRHAIRCALTHIDNLENIIAEADLEVQRLEKKLEKQR